MSDEPEARIISVGPGIVGWDKSPTDEQVREAFKMLEELDRRLYGEGDDDDQG